MSHATIWTDTTWIFHNNNEIPTKELHIYTQNSTSWMAETPVI
jgi:hypothetical protein